MSKLTLNFNVPFENSQQKVFLKNLKEIGFSVERVFQGGKYIQWRYYARLPNVNLCNEGSIDLIFSDSAKTDFLTKNIDSIELILLFERKNSNEDNF